MWASIDGRIDYPVHLSRISWEPSDALLDVQTSGPSQNHVTGSITLKCAIRKFPKGYKFWRYASQLLNPLMTNTFGQREVWEAKPLKRLQEELVMFEGFRDIRAASLEAKEAGGWEGTGNEIYCAVIARTAKEAPLKWGYPAFFDGRPRSLVCLYLTPVLQAEVQRLRHHGMYFDG
jgi:hypothetical protein